MKLGLLPALAPILLFALAAGCADDKAGPAVRQPDAKSDVPAFRSQTFDDLGDFHRIVILSDATGSMINKMASLKDQINKGIASLEKETVFNILFFQDSKLDEVAAKMVPATHENKQKATQFLEGITSTCTTDPMASIEEAFREKPEVIYLITDGDFPDNDAVLKKFRELNKDKTVKVYTIAFVDHIDTDTAFIGLLKTIASESGGKFSRVDAGKL